jgi:DNA-binding transcriptional ArsR family regulator
MPSAYAWPHSRVNCDAPWPLAMIHPAPFVLRAARSEPAPQDLVGVLKALADPTRLRALQMIAERPRSTEELAPLVALAEPGLSKHLRVLSAAGLITSRRDGHYVLYSLDRERLDALGPDVLAFVGARVSAAETTSEPSPQAPAT